ncbi:MAG: GerMN domain-containing protein [Dictyoglomus sp.]
MKKIILGILLVLLLIFIALIFYLPTNLRVVLYTYNNKSQLLERKEISLKITLLDRIFKENIYKKTLQQLIEISLENKDNFPIPKGTKLLGLSVKDSIAYVNFSEEFRKNHPGGSLGELLTIYSIVNTLTEFPEIKKVQILINGAILETLAGHIDLTSPIERDLSIVR